LDFLDDEWGGLESDVLIDLECVLCDFQMRNEGNGTIVGAVIYMTREGSSRAVVRLWGSFLNAVLESYFIAAKMTVLVLH
jgi:hypothetical protein